MRTRLLSIGLALLGFLMSPAILMAQDELDVKTDARLEGYPSGQNVFMPEADSTGLTWFLLVVLGVVCLIGMFKHARRSHLD
jgi:hypothetical protein